MSASIASTDIDAEKSVSTVYPCCDPDGFKTKRSLSLDWLGTVKGRFGYLVTDSSLLYGLAGIAFTDIKVTQRWSDDYDAIASSSSRDFVVGYVIGAGVEHKFTDTISLKAEYNFIDFETQGTKTTVIGHTDPFNTRSDLKLHNLNIGLMKYF